jgi:membrane protein DedA with SNARE-associated domain
MELWVSFWSGLTSFIAQHGLLTVAVIVMLKSAGIPLPVPGDLVVVFVGVEARAGEVAFGEAWLVLSAATIVGAGLLFDFAHWIGPGEMVHYGHYVGLSQPRLQAAEAQLRSRGARAIFAARIVPGLRLAIVVVSAILGIPRRTVFPALSFAALVYVGACLAVGYLAGPALTATLEQFVFPAGLAVPLVALGILLVWIVRARRDLDLRSAQRPLRRADRIRAGTVAGVLATMGSSMLVNALVYVGGPVIATALSPPFDQVWARLGSWDGLWSLLGALVSVVLVGVIVGAVYGVVEEHWLPTRPGVIRGLTFATGPLAFSLLLVWRSDMSTGGWLLGALVETVRWTAYGLILGLTDPIFRERRSVRPGGDAERPSSAERVLTS